MVFLMHSVTAATIAAGGGPRAADVLKQMASGSALGTLAFSERGTGAHFYSPELKATRSNGGVTLSGRKSFVTSGGHADAYLVLVQGEAEGAADAYLLPSDRAGVHADGSWSGLGMAGNSSVALELDDVELGPDDLIGAPGEAIGLVFNAVAPFFLIGLAAVNVGIAAAAAAAATAHARDRRYPEGSSLAEIQYVQHLIADMDLVTRQARLLVREAARLGEAGDESALVAIIEAKVAATEAAATRAGAVMAPTNAVLRNWIGKALAGLPVP
jgi:alkylation response protein AidB-like acyl-CoA dehydrogenase